MSAEHIDFRYRHESHRFCIPLDPSLLMVRRCEFYPARGRARARFVQGRVDDAQSISVVARKVMVSLEPYRRKRWLNHPTFYLTGLGRIKQSLAIEIKLMGTRMAKRHRVEDWVSLLETFYLLDGDDRAWMHRILSCAAKDIWRGKPSAAYTFELMSSGFSLGVIAAHGVPEQQVREVIMNSSSDVADLAFKSGTDVATLSEYLWSKDPGHKAMFKRATANTPDALGVVAHSGDGRGVVLSLSLEEPRNSTISERRRWKFSAAHLGAALRLRRAILELDHFDGTQVEAIFDGSGKLFEARNGAVTRTARDVLRDAVLRIDKLRTSDGRHDPDAALGNWEALVRGRWSIVDKFDTDGRRFVVAVRNDPRFGDCRGLSLQERQVAEFIGLGRSTKEVAYILGIPPASAENSARRVQVKLGLKSRAELVAFFAPQGVRARLATMMVGNDPVLIGSSIAGERWKVAGLTESENAVLSLLVAGSSNQDIALKRSTSARTVANQIQSIFRKLSVRSRGELISHLAMNETSVSVGN